MQTKQYNSKQLVSQWSYRRRNLKIHETSENENTIVKHLWDTAKVVLRGKYIAIEAYLGKQENTQINYLSPYLKELKKEQTKPKVSRINKIIKFRAEINYVEIKRTIEKSAWNPDLVLWKDKANWQTLSQTHQEKRRKDSNE